MPGDLTDPALAHAVLVEHNDAFMKGPALSFFMKPMLGNGLLSSEGEFHHKQRRMLAPSFMPRRLADYATTIAARSEASQAALRDGRVTSRELVSQYLARIAQYEMAFRMQMSATEVMDIGREPAKVLESYGAQPGAGTFANNCLLARRLVEAGVRYVQLFDWGWDFHGTNPNEDIRDGLTLRRWSLSRAWPVKFVAGEWDNESDENIIESVTLTYDFFELVQ